MRSNRTTGKDYAQHAAARALAEAYLEWVKPLIKDPGMQKMEAMARAALQSPPVATAQQSEAPPLPMLFRSDDEEHLFGYGMCVSDTHPAIARVLGAFQVVRAHPAAGEATGRGEDAA